MLFNNIQTTFPEEESDFLSVFGRLGLNFKMYLMKSLTEDRVTSLNDLCTVSTNRLVELMFINKI